MWEVSAPSQGRTGSVLLGLAILLAAVSFLISRFSHTLCTSGLPITVPSIAVPGIGALSAFIALFFASSRASVRSVISITAVKVAVLAVNLYMLALAGILLTGMGLVNCG